MSEPWARRVRNVPGREARRARQRPGGFHTDSSCTADGAGKMTRALCILAYFLTLVNCEYVLLFALRLWPTNLSVHVFVFIYTNYYFNFWVRPKFIWSDVKLYVLTAASTEPCKNSSIFFFSKYLLFILQRAGNQSQYYHILIIKRLLFKISEDTFKMFLWSREIWNNMKITFDKTGQKIRNVDMRKIC